jgi:alkylation response protein AidB-like acyl-CoA dehydrogenase
VNLDLTETQILFRDTVRQYLEKEVPFARVRRIEAEQAADAELWRALGAQGWLAMPLPDALGGGGGGLVDAGLLVEELMRRAALVPAAESLACGVALARAGEGAAAAELVRRLAEGEATPVPAVLEAGDRLAPEAFQAAVGSDGRLRGEKYFVDYAELATHHVVAARGGAGLGLYLVERGDPAVKCEKSFALGRIPQAIVRYDGAPATRVAGEAGYRLLVNAARALASVQILACMQQALDQAVAYTNVRVQFGRPLSTFQAVQHHGANMALHVESSRFLVYEVLDALDRGAASDAQVALVKASVSRSVPEVTMLSHQLHGGHGFIEENDLYFFTLRGKDRSLAWGSAEECLEIVAGEVEEPARWL